METPMKRILLAEDEVNIASFISRGLTEYGYEVITAANGTEGWESITRQRFDLLILDIMMPGMNGLELCRRFRQHYGYSVPVIMLTALGSTEDIVSGLDAGADDYVVKPFSFGELDARLRALLRRGNEQAGSGLLLTYGDLELNCSLRRARRQTTEVDLTDKEFRLLEYFMRHPNTVLSRSTLLKEVWDKDFDTNTNVVDVYVNYLRGKIDRDFSGKLIHTVVGLGYIMQQR